MESTKTEYECDCCGEQFSELKEFVFHRPSCAKLSSNATRLSEVHKSLGIAANKINDLRFNGYYSDECIQELTNKIAEIQKEIG